MENNKTTSVVLAGVGGQGILLASEVIARAAMLAGYDVKTNEVHGMAQRGGSVLGQIRYGKKVYSPLVAFGEAKALGSFEQIEAIRYAQYIAPDGLAVVSSQMIVPVTVSGGRAKYPGNSEQRLKEVFPQLKYFDAGELALKVGDLRTANIIVLGAMSTALELSVETWHLAIADCVAAKYKDINLKAFDTGRSLVF